MKVINVKKASTALVLGSIISCLALSGCGMSNSKQNSEKDIETGTAILVENKDAILIKLHEPNYNGYRTSAIDRYIILGTASGDKILVDQRSVQIIIGENSYEKAEAIAESLVDESGQIINYDDMQKTRKLK